jgi:hypothetical protein
MNRARALAGALVTLWFPLLACAATPVHKCVVDGTVTYQTDACPSGQVRQRPTVGQLNAERARQGAAASAPLGSRAAAASTAETSAAHSPAAPNAAAAAPFRCDGRKYCSQMNSCAEAKYFLANCPGVRMDGNRDGLPCEKQWCGR